MKNDEVDISFEEFDAIVKGTNIPRNKDDTQNKSKEEIKNDPDDDLVILEVSDDFMEVPKGIEEDLPHFQKPGNS